jgi:hypothetical protein
LQEIWRSGGRSVAVETGDVVILLDDFALAGAKIMLSGGVEGSRNQAGGLGELDGLGAALGAELVKEAAGVGFHGVFANE